MPLLNIAGRYADALGSGVQSVAAKGFNMLPDRMNLFARYLTGVGNKNLKLDPSTERSLIQATEKYPTTTIEVDNSFLPPAMAAENNNPSFSMSIQAAGSGVPMSGATYPYGSGDQIASQTLGRFNAEVTPTTVRVRDTYDMVNTAEDPDLVSGKFQPGKAYRTLRGAFDPTQIYDPKTDKLRNIGHLLSPEQKNFGNYMNQVGKSTTFSPLSNVARAAMYALPVKFQPYEIDYTIQRPQ